MKKIYIVVIVLVAIIMVWFLFDRSNKVEAPAVMNDVAEKNTDTKSVSPISNAMPVPNTAFPVEEKVVVKEFTVSGQNFSFTPSSIVVKKGDNVKITFKSVQGFHDFKIDEYGVATKQLKSPALEVLEFTANKAGTFEYYCSVGSHRSMGMVGKLKVE